MRSTTGVRFNVFIDGKLDKTAREVNVRRGMMLSGGIDHCTFTIHPEGSGRYLSTEPHKGFFDDRYMNKICQVQMVSDDSSASEGWIHYGRIGRAETSRDQTSEDLAYTSRFDTTLFENVVRHRLTAHDRRENISHKVMDGFALATSGPLGIVDALTEFVTRDVEALGGDLVFNPVMDGVQMPNRYINLSLSRAAFVPLRMVPEIFVDPRSIPQEVIGELVIPETSNNIVESLVNNVRQLRLATRYHIGFWTLHAALSYLFYTLNPREEHVSNPSNAAVAKMVNIVTPSDGGQYLRNVTIPVGTNLLDAMRTLLSPFGVDVIIRHESMRNRYLDFVVRHKADKIVLPAAVSDQLTTLDDVAPQWSIACDTVDNMINQVEIQGGVPLVEVTMELMPAWEPKFDNRSVTDLAEDSDWYLEEPEHRRVWRDWVANENGEYDDLRDHPANPNVVSAFHGGLAKLITKFVRSIPGFRELFKLFKPDSYSLFTPTVMRRRRLLPMVTASNKTTNPVGHVNGIEVEFSTDGGSSWTPIDRLDDAKVEILSTECGIRFAGAHPPMELYASGVDNAKVRVTATIEGDAPVRVIHYDSKSLAKGERTLVIKNDTKYRMAYRSDSGNIASKYANVDHSFAYRLRNDLDAMHSKAWQYLANWSTPTVNGNLVIDDMQWLLKVEDVLGKSIESLNGRRFRLSGKAKDTSERITTPVISSLSYSENGQVAAAQIQTSDPGVV